MTDQPSDQGRSEPTNSSPGATSPDAIATEDTVRLHTPAMTPMDAIANADTARLRMPAILPDPISAEDTHRLRTPAPTLPDPIANADTARLRMPPAQVPLEVLATQLQMPIASPQPVTPPHPTAPPRLVPTPLVPMDRQFSLTLAAIAIIFALLGTGLLVASYNTAQANIQPERVVQSFCQNLQSHHYAAAYALLSSSYQASLSEAEFTSLSQLQDQVDGEIRACPVATGPNLDLAFGTPQTLTSYLITILRNQPHSGHIAVVRQSDAWKVDALQQSLAGTNVGPLVTVQTFCTAITKGDFAAAYGALSSRQRKLATEPVFAAQFREALGGPVKLGSCTMNYATYTVRTSGASVVTTFNLIISTESGGSMTTRLATRLSLITENGVWKLDDFSPQPSAR